MQKVSRPRPKEEVISSQLDIIPVITLFINFQTLAALKIDSMASIVTLSLTP